MQYLSIAFIRRGPKLYCPESPVAKWALCLTNSAVRLTCQDFQLAWTISNIFVTPFHKLRLVSTFLTYPCLAKTVWTLRKSFQNIHKPIVLNLTIHYHIKRHVHVWWRYWLLNHIPKLSLTGQSDAWIREKEINEISIYKKNAFRNIKPFSLFR